MLPRLAAIIALAVLVPAAAAMPMDTAHAQSRDWFRKNSLSPQALTLDEAVRDIEQRFGVVVKPEYAAETVGAGQVIDVAKGYEITKGVDDDSKTQSLVFAWYLATLVAVEKSANQKLAWIIKPKITRSIINGKPYVILVSRFRMV